jgi:hypothetical protein
MESRSVLLRLLQQASIARADLNACVPLLLLLLLLLLLGRYFCD